MRIIAFIMALTLLGGSVKGSPVADLVMSVIGMGHCDHTSETTSCHSSDEEPSDSCCGDMDCECTCCVHILICPPMTDLVFAAELFATEQSFFDISYHRDHLSSVFHPPILG